MLAHFLQIVAVMRIMHEMNHLATDAEKRHTPAGKGGNRQSIDGALGVTGHHHRLHRKTTLGVQMRRAVRAAWASLAKLPWYTSGPGEGQE